MIRILHTADWHADSDREKQIKFDHAMESISEYLCKNKVDAIVHAGDIWERKQSYTVNSGVPDVVHWLRAFAKRVPHIFIVKGNNSHDEPGSVELLNNLEPNIHAVEEPTMFFVNGTDSTRYCLDYIRAEIFDEQPQYIVTLIPYPTKQFFIDQGSIDNLNADMAGMIDEYFGEIGEIADKFSCPKVMAFHGNVSGSRLSSGQSLITQDVMIAPASLKKAKHDYYALGHIHIAQEVAQHMFYSGSVYNKNWGETEQKGFMIAEFNRFFSGDMKGVPHTEFIPIPWSRPMWTVEAIFDPEAGFIETSGDFRDNGEIRYRVKVKEADRVLMTKEKIDALIAALERDGNKVKFEVTVVPNERESRNEAIMKSATLLDEVCEYAGTTKQEIERDAIADKVQFVEEGGAL